MIKHKEIVLVHLPIADMKFPAMALSLFKAMLSKAGIGAKIDYANMYFYQQIGEDNYRAIAGCHYGAMLGECVFTPAAFPEFRVDWNSYEAYIRSNPSLKMVTRLLPNFLQEMQKEAVSFIERTVERILQDRPKIVAIGSMFQQNNAMFALVKALRQRDPQLIIMVGGCNCSSSAGKAIMKKFPEIDYIFQGEADEILVELCQRLLAGMRPTGDELPYGIMDKHSDFSRDVHRLTQDLNALPYPDYDDYFSTLEALKLEGEVEATLHIEGSRGCWWGEKQQCTFCGLNGLGVIYRQKNTERLVTEIKYLLEHYPSRRIFFTDSVMSYLHMKELPTKIKEAALPKALYFTEIKANATLREIQQLVEVGIQAFQPGIESLNDHVLRLMNKGCKAIRQIETMKNYRRCRAWFTWNLLCGFPGEREEDYWEMAKILPLISHLCPPKAFFNIAYHKSSVYEKNREAYGLSLQPLGVYKYVFPLGNAFIRDMAYIFEQVELEERMKDEDVFLRSQAHGSVYELVEEWNKGYYRNSDRLDMQTKADGSIEIMDLRHCSRKSLYNLQGIRAKIYTLTESVIKKDRLIKELSINGYTKEEIEESLADLMDNRLILNIGEEYLALAIEEVQ